MDYNIEQKQAIEYNKTGAVAIISGAGTGKTTVLTKRIEYLINEFGFLPNEILAITFTNKAGLEIKNRLMHININNLNWVGTFHSICFKILKIHINKLGRNNNFKIIDNDDSIRVIKQILEKHNYQEISPKMIYTIIEKIKTRYGVYGFNQTFADEHISDKNIQKIWKEYEEILFLNNFLDFNDLLIYTNYLLSEHKDIKNYWSNMFKYILVDEFQDTNDIQYNFLKLIMNDNNNICVIGDPDQSIYAFRGADPNIINNFINDFNAYIIVLKQNYRSTQQILDVANDLINHNTNNIKKTLISATNSIGDLPLLYKASDDATEAAYVVKKIKELSQKTNLNNIAILLRSSHLSRYFEQELVYENINYRFFGGIKFFQRSEIKDLISYLSLYVNNDDLSILRTINTPRRKIGAETIKNIINIDKNDSIYNNLLKVNNYNFSNQVKKSIESYLSLINEIRNFNFSSIIELLNFIIDKTKILEYYKKIDPNRYDNIFNNINELKKSISEFEKTNQNNNINDYISSINLYTDNNEQNINSDYVNIMTVHSAKGLEFDYVFLCGFNDNIFPSYQAIDEGKNALEEERRIAYVAITRAKKELVISYSEDIDYRYHSNKKPSRFIYEISPNLLAKPISKYIKKESFFNSFNIHKNNESKKEDNFRNDIDINSFKVSDIVEHKLYGIGTIVEINDTILVIKFSKPVGIKNIKYNHNYISKVFDDK